MWAAVTVYAVSAILFAIGLVFRAEKAMTGGVLVAAAGLLPHLFAITVRWIRIGHGPYLGFYEVVSFLALLGVAMLVGVVYRYRGLAVAGAVVMPLSFLLIAGAMLAPSVAEPITPTLASWWLAIHVTFAKLTYAAFVTAFALAIVYLARNRLTAGRYADVFAKLPRQEVLDDLAFRFVGLGFIFLGIMIAAGAIWANEAWGRYWGWDPIETWSLISWLVYAAVLHARLTLGWRGRRFAWATVAALPIVVFALIGVPAVYKSIHGAYLLGTK